jgi:hypothetical protein
MKNNMTGYYLVEEEEREKAAAAALAAPQTLREQLAAVDRQIAEVTAQLDPVAGDDPAFYPLRRRLVSLWNKRHELTEQLKKGAK